MNHTCMTFTGWNTKPDGSGDAIQPGDLLPPLTADITLYAQWDDTSCDVTPLAQTGIGVSTPFTVMLGMMMLGATTVAARIFARRRNR